MNCPSKETLQDLIDGALSKDMVAQVVRHVKSCDLCRHELVEIHAVYEGLDHLVSEDRCPSLESLESYGRSAAGESDRTDIERHVGLCSRCRSLVWAFRASTEELADWQAREEAAFEEFSAQNLGQEAAQEILRRLLPGKVSIFQEAWRAVLTLVLDLKGKAMETWPPLDTGTHLVGALAFAESFDPETDATLIILATTLYVSQGISDGEIKPDREDVESAVQEVAARLGAGKQLRQRLMDTAVPIILRFKRDADA